MNLNKSQRLKTVIATCYCLTWFFTDGFDWGIDFPPNSYDESVALFVLLIPPALLFFAEIKRWVTSGGE
jgi:hypothetical protein